MLEIGVGTGRIALPLAARGCHITGVDIASEMLAELRRKGERSPGKQETSERSSHFSTRLRLEPALR